MRESWDDPDLVKADKAERMDADAVCVECGTVNPDGALFCKSCGNNLRDQRMHRLQNAGTLPPPAETVETATKTWLRGLLALFGFLLIIAVFMYVENFETWLAYRMGNTDSGDDPASYWTGRDKDRYDALALKLDDFNPNPAERAAALDQPATGSTIQNGRYLLVQESPLTGKIVVGQAEVAVEDTKAFFVVRFGQRVEGRGEIWIDADGRLKSEGLSGIRKDGAYYLAGGIATRLPSGAYQCYGQSEVDSFTYDALAYRVPLPEGGSDTGEK